MNQYILIDHIEVQNANAIAGFTWGFPAITHFLGFMHNLYRKLENMETFAGIALDGCAVISHEHQVQAYGSWETMFTQSRNPPYLPSHDKAATPPVIEEGKMNMTVSLLIGCHGNIGNREDDLKEWLENTCKLQRLAGGTIFNIKGIDVYKPENTTDVRQLTRRLLPGFVLLERSQYLEDHYQNLLQENSDTEFLDAWLDFCALKQKARPQSKLISKYLQSKLEKEPENEMNIRLLETWHKHLEVPYERDDIPNELLFYFKQQEMNKADPKLLNQWQEYCDPNEKTVADWEYIKKPETGYLVPIMIGYKAISEVYANEEVSNTRDHKTDACFVESVHSIGEWQSVHRLKTPDQLKSCLWYYDQYVKDWYLCRQGIESQVVSQIQNIDIDDDSENSIYS